MVDSLAALDRYPWSAHGSVLGSAEYDWHVTGYVLNWFGKRLKHARQAYRIFMERGIAIGQLPHLVGGGFVRPAGGWSEVKALRRIGMQEKGNDRILGSGAFVSQLLSEVGLKFVSLNWIYNQFDILLESFLKYIVAINQRRMPWTRT